MQMWNEILGGGAGVLLDLIPVAGLVCLGVVFLRKRHAFLSEKRRLLERIDAYRAAGKQQSERHAKSFPDIRDEQTAGSIPAGQICAVAGGTQQDSTAQHVTEEEQRKK